MGSEIPAGSMHLHSGKSSRTCTEWQSSNGLPFWSNRTNCNTSANREKVKRKKLITTRTWPNITTYKKCATASIRIFHPTQLAHTPQITESFTVAWRRRLTNTSRDSALEPIGRNNTQLGFRCGKRGFSFSSSNHLFRRYRSSPPN